MTKKRSRVFLLLLVVIIGCSSPSSPDSADQELAVNTSPAPSPVIPLFGSPDVTGEPDRRFVKGEWEFLIFYRSKGSRSEGQHGILLHRGEPIVPTEEKRDQQTPFGVMAHYGSDPAAGWSPTGWNFKDYDKIRPSWEVDPASEKSEGTILFTDRMTEPQTELERRIDAAPDRVMGAAGLAGAVGGAQVRVVIDAPQQILLPLPQLVNGQVPIAFFISATPPDAVTEYRLQKRDAENTVVFVHLRGKKQEVSINWASVVLLTSQEITPNRTIRETYRVATSCVQSTSSEVIELAADLWPESAESETFATELQRHVREMQMVDRPRTFDAVGILKSGANSICTANANLAAALLRSRGIACRSIAVIPTISQRLEMHRVVEFAGEGDWVSFDPSSVQTDVPAPQWQNIIMAKTTKHDEEVAMTPRMGVAIGCPYAQEIELLTLGVHLAFRDFYWTMAKPLVDIDATEKTAHLAAAAWTRFLDTGTLSAVQLEASSVISSAEFEALWIERP